MHRFGRSAQQKMKDRWGGGFILATILALAAAWYAGDLLGRTAGTVDGKPPVAGNMNNGGASLTAEPQEFSVHFVRVGVFDFASNANNMLKRVSSLNYPAVMGPKNDKGWSPVYAGPFTSEQAAMDAKAQLEQALAKDVKSTVMETVTVPHNTNVVAVSTSNGKANQLQEGMDLLNSYLHEVSRYLEARVNDPNADATGVMAYGRDLADMAATMASETDARVKKFVDMASRAGTNATGLTATMNGDDQVQAAMNDYMSLVKDYRNFK